MRVIVGWDLVSSEFDLTLSVFSPDEPILGSMDELHFVPRPYLQRERRIRVVRRTIGTPANFEEGSGGTSSYP